MGGRIPSVRQAAFVVALLVSVAAYAYSLGAIAGTGGEVTFTDDGTQTGGLPSGARFYRVVITSAGLE